MSYKFKHICLKVIPVAFILLLFQAANAQSTWKPFEQLLNEKQDVLGKDMVVMVAGKDSLLFKKEYGVFNSKTVAPIASCSKWLTAALVLQFADEGLLSLDDKVTKFIPEFGKYFKGYITIRQCLGHMTGIADDDKFIKKILQRRKFESLEEEVNEFAAREIRAKPGTDFWYGNIGLNIAGRIVEVISKKKFEVIIKTKLFSPLGMTKTTFAETTGSPVNPSGGAKSTADDYMKFLTMLLNNGSYNGKQILSANAIKTMREIQNTPGQIAFAPKSAQGLMYTYGSWAVETTDNKNATALASPGLFGTWPMVDFQRGYIYIVFVKNLLGDERADIHLQLKKLADSAVKK